MRFATACIISLFECILSKSDYNLKQDVNSKQTLAQTKNIIINLID